MIKHGMILDLNDFSNLEWSQGPQVLILKDCLRIYFSTRRQEGKYYYSDIAYADFDLGSMALDKVSRHEIISRGKLGTFDFDGIFPFHVFQDPRSQRVLGFICGWKRKVSVDIDMSIGLAESDDGGETFFRLGEGPILTANLDESFLIGDPFLKWIGDRYYMFYIRGEAWLPTSDGHFERQYRITCATSQDFNSWDRKITGMVPKRFTTEAQAMPSVACIDGVFHLIYCYRDTFDFRKNPLNGYRIGHAFSRDLESWSISDFEIPLGSSGEWDSEMQCYPQLFELNEKVYIVYNGNNFGRFGIGLVELSREELASYARF